MKQEPVPVVPWLNDIGGRISMNRCVMADGRRLNLELRGKN